MLSSGIYTFAGSLLGGFLAIGGNLIIEHFKQRREIRQVCVATAATIASTIWIVDQRRLVDALGERLPALDAGDEVSFFGFTKEGDIFDQGIERALETAGKLPNQLPFRVMKFCAITAGIKIDIVRLVAGDFPNAVAKAAMIREDVALWEKARADGLQLIGDLHTAARRINDTSLI